MATNDPKPTKSERRDVARARAEALRQEQLKREQRRRVYLVSAAVAAPAGATARAGSPSGSDGAAGATIPAGVVVVDIYTDFMCPVCGLFEQQNGADLDAFGKSGTAVIVYHPISILDRASNGTNYSTRAAQAAAVVADKDPTHYLAFDQALFANQPKEDTNGLTNGQLEQLAQSAGVPSAVTATFVDGKFTDWVAAATEDASKNGVSGTPTVKINGKVFGGNWQAAGELKTAIQAATGQSGSPSASPTPSASPSPSAS
jgi:protein-disulfide isomerase